MAKKKQRKRAQKATPPRPAVLCAAEDCPRFGFYRCTHEGVQRWLCTSHHQMFTMQQARNADLMAAEARQPSLRHKPLYPLAHLYDAVQARNWHLSGLFSAMMLSRHVGAPPADFLPDAEAPTWAEATNRAAEKHGMIQIEEEAE